jgi:hypothetical protein
MRLVAACLLALFCAGCASATRGWEEQIAVSSTPSGVDAVVTGSSYPEPCVTPCVIKAKRNDEISITFNKEGYQTQVVTLKKEIATNGAIGFAGNILLGGGIGMLVDGASGAALDHKPNPVIVTMQPRRSASKPASKPLKPKPSQPPVS